ncbi:MAG: hypothetical protein M3Q07_20340 [Pseudobdellovibrionaceae bacterium]|nr:hypothetical protein [Pseudobdellovibrionaceae bacterium]
MAGKRLLSVVLLCLSGFFLSLGVSQCGVKQPKVENSKFASPVADHARFTDPCAACHEFRRLPPTQDLTLVAHGFGRECSECHQYIATAPSWTPKAYSHSPTPPACLGCHNLPGEAAKFSKPAAHGNGQLRGDCAACHRFGTQWKVN